MVIKAIYRQIYALRRKLLEKDSHDSRNAKNTITST